MPTIYLAWSRSCLWSNLES